MANIVNTYWLKASLAGDKSSGVITQNETVLITFDEVVDNVIDAVESSGFIEGQPHRLKPFELFLNDDIGADVLEDDTGLTWEFTLVYTTRPWGGSTTTDADEFYVPEVTFGKWSYQLVVDRDKETGEAFLNPAGDPIDPLPIESISSLILFIKVKENDPYLSRVADVGSINKSAITIAGVTIPAYCGMLDNYTPDPSRETEDVISFFNTFAIKLKYFKNKAGEQIGFKLEQLNEGFNFLPAGVSADKQEFTVKDDDGEPVPVATPQLLAENGDTSTTATYTERVANDVIEFSQFRLPTSYPVS